MDFSPMLATLRAARVVPVVRMHKTENAARAVGWLREAGMRVFEITMTIPGAVDLIRTLAADKSLLVGAGTVADAAAARACIAAGARFIVAPWVDATLAGPCHEAGAALMLGAMSPTEIRAALAAGADVVKLFPISSMGGPAHIKSVAAVFPGVAFCPTGSVGTGEVGAYLAAGAAFVGIGGPLVSEKQAEAGDQAAVTATVRAMLA